MNRTVLATLTLALLIGVPTAAQGPGGFGGDPKQMVDRQVEQMKEDLKLTAEQEEKVRPILEESLGKSMELRKKMMADGGGPSPELRDEMVKNQEHTNGALGKILDEDQMKKYKKIQEERRSRFGGGQRGGPGGGQDGQGQRRRGPGGNN